MLGRIKRTSRTDVGLAISFAGIVYLVWALVAGISRHVVQEFIKSAAVHGLELPEGTRLVKMLFVQAGFVIDLVGLAWLAASLLLVWLSSRQRCTISWAWVCAVCQAMVAALGAVLVCWGIYMPHMISRAPEMTQTPWETVSEISLPVIAVAAVVLWVVVLVWLLVDRSRLDRRGPSLRDGLRTTNVR